MRTTLNIPDELINEVRLLTGQRNESQAIVKVMEEYVKRRKIENLLALRGKINIDYDWQREKETEMALDRQHFELITGQSTYRGNS